MLGEQQKILDEGCDEPRIDENGPVSAVNEIGLTGNNEEQKKSEQFPFRRADEFLLLRS